MKGNHAKYSSKLTTRKIGRILYAVQYQLVTLMKAKAIDYDEAMLELVMSDENIRKEVQNLIRSGRIRLIHAETNEPLYKREMTLIGEKGDRAVNESPQEET